jgi:hypothetical protein
VKKDVLQLSDARNFEGTEMSGSRTLNFLLHSSSCCMFPHWISFVLDSSPYWRTNVICASQQTEPALLRLININVRAAIVLGVCESCSGRFKALQRRQFLHKNFKPYLIICLPGVSQSRLRVVEGGNFRHPLWHAVMLYVMWRTVRTKLDLHLGPICNLPVFINAAFCPENC